MHKLKAVVLEALSIAVLGFGFALLANAISPSGLRLNRDYFPAAPVSAGRSVTPITSQTSPASSPTEQRLAQRGLQIIGSNDVVSLFHDVRYQQGLIVFVDARDDSHYQAGHIPGAWQFNHYRAEQFLPAVLPVSLNAEKIVVYCSGGNCEDSEFAALMLRDAGVPAEKLFVYVGGIAEWTTNALPVERGSRGSAQLAPRKQ